MANLILRACVCQRGGSSSPSSMFKRNGARRARSTLCRRGPLSVLDYIIDSGGKIVHASAWHDDGIPTSVSFLGDPEKLAAIIFAEFHVEMLPFDLQLPRLDEIIHL